jgi:adenylosuccinate synthase
MQPKMDVIVDLQFGSTGKGALAGYLGEKNGYEAVISCNMPNAGHTAYSPDDDQKFVHKVLPSAIFGDNLQVIGVGPGAVFFPDRLVEEWAAVCKYRDDLTLIIHEAAGIATEEHKAREQASLSRIASTMQGSAEALISKIRREDSAIVKHRAVALYERLKEHGKVRIADQAAWLEMAIRKDKILLEGSQGYSLGISAGFYPYCTSRDCTPARVIADCNLPVGWLRDVYGSCRVHPIRVGNTPDGYSGSWYPDQTEIHFSDLHVPDEKTTVTQRVRRIATFSEIQIEEAMAMALPAFVFLNFANYDEDEAMRVTEIINGVAATLDCGGVSFVGYGPRPSDIRSV